MKKIIAAFVIMVFVAGTSTAFARGYSHGGHGGHYYGYHGSRHHHNGLGIAFGVAGGLLLGSALVAATTPPAYGTVVVEQPRVCVEDRVVRGEWRINRHGRQFWVPYAYPVTQRIQVPCY